MPQVLIIKPVRDEAVKYPEEMSIRGKYMIHQWAQPDDADVNEHTQFLIYKQTGNNPCAVEPWFNILRRLRGFDDIVEPNASETCQWNGLTDLRAATVGMWRYLADSNEEIYLKNRAEYSMYSRQSLKHFVFDVRLAQNMPDVIGFIPEDPAEDPVRNFPAMVETFGKCMRLRATMQSSGRAIVGTLVTDPDPGTVSSPVNEATLFVIYKRDNSCESSEHHILIQSPLLAKKFFKSRVQGELSR